MSIRLLTGPNRFKKRLQTRRTNEICPSQIEDDFLTHKVLDAGRSEGLRFFDRQGSRDCDHRDIPMTFHMRLHPMPPCTSCSSDDTPCPKRPGEVRHKKSCSNCDLRP